MVFVDTSVWIEYFRGLRTDLVGEVNRLIDEDRIRLGIPVRIEILSGARGREVGNLEKILGFVPTFYPNQQTWREIEEFIRFARKKGQVFGMGDLLVAAIARENGGAVWSLDQDFKRMVKLGWIKGF